MLYSSIPILTKLTYKFNVVAVRSSIDYLWTWIKLFFKYIRRGDVQE